MNRVDAVEIKELLVEIVKLIGNLILFGALCYINYLLLKALLQDLACVIG